MVAEIGEWRWLHALYEGLQKAEVPVESVQARSGEVTVRAMAGGEPLEVELVPRDRGGPCFAAVGRHLVRYRAPASLAPDLRDLLKTMLRIAMQFEPRIPVRFVQSYILGTGGPAEELRTRFPFAFVERSGDSEVERTEVMIRSSGCNQSCPFCIAPPVRAAGTETFRACIDLACQLFPGARITLTGGEPLLRRNFSDELAFLLSRPEPSTVQVQTNAVLLAEQARVESMICDPRLDFFVSLHATKEPVYDACTGTSGNMHRALQGISNLLHAGHTVTINCVANRLNVDHLMGYVQDVVRLFGGHGGLRLHFSVMICPLGKPNMEKLLVRYSVLAPLLEEAVEYASTAGIFTGPLISSTHASIPMCLVSARQQSLSCNHPVIEEGETAYEDFSRSWIKAERCRGCSYAFSCLGVPSPYAMRFGLDELVPVQRPASPSVSGVVGAI